uniref:Reverse transcriptase domain-containing protein n=1 Tax=Tanacetum cinerariifolium TaxID=118510 RepID=A0A6L2LUA3_TANCI|nr:reverse transcriptase domain-containing protein [Tanacetum cinerariifolium]
MRYSSTYNDNSVNRVDVIDIACEEFVQDVLEFQYNSKSYNPTLVSDSSCSEETKSEFCKKPIVKSSSPTLTPFGESDFFLEEIEDFLKDESNPTRIKDSFFDPEGDILYLKKLLNDDPSQLSPMDLKQEEKTKAKSSIEEPLELELKELPSHLEYAFLEESDKLPVIIAKLKDVEKKALIKVLKSHKRAIAWKISDIKGHKISKFSIEVDREKVDVIAKLPHPTTVKGVRSFLGHAGCIDAFKTLKKKLTEAPILVVPDWNLPFERISENLAADHLSRLENPHKDVLENKDINENFSLETLGSLSSESTPCARGTHFGNDQFARVMTKYEVTHRLATTYRHQMSGQVEVSNRGLKRILERTVEENRASWSDKLDDALMVRQVG